MYIKTELTKYSNIHESKTVLLPFNKMDEQEGLNLSLWLLEF